MHASSAPDVEPGAEVRYYRVTAIALVNPATECLERVGCQSGSPAEGEAITRNQSVTWRLRPIAAAGATRWCLRGCEAVTAGSRSRCNADAQQPGTRNAT